MGQEVEPAGVIVDKITAHFADSPRTVHNDQEIGGVYVFTGGCDVLYIALCQQCDNLWTFATDAERLRWIGMHQGPGHTLEAALMIRTP